MIVVILAPKQSLPPAPKEHAMKHRSIWAAAFALAAIFIPAAQAAGPSMTTNPGFVSQTGQINPGSASTSWSATPSLPRDQQPSQDEVRAALMAPDPVGVPSLGKESAPEQNGGSQTTTGAGPAATAAPPGPIGATLQTMPAKYSQRNDLLDHVPLMAWPLPLNQQQLQQIYQAVMAQESPPAEGIDKLKPSSALSFEQTRDMHQLPHELAGIDGLQGLEYVKGKSTVLLIKPSARIVVAQIAR
jgi:hypothetical protein